jgi:lipoprotein-releasing system ATP-binding protein
MLEVTNVSKEFTTPRGPISVLSGISFALRRGEAAAIMGPSGSGKSSLLYILGALERPSTGTVTLNARNPFELNDRELSGFRNKEVGFIFQDHCLLPQCSALENVLVPTLVTEPAKKNLERARALLDQVGLKDRAHHRPSELSGGEKQRVALARALVREPLLLLCDEPTGNLDRTSADGVASLLVDLHKRQQTILIIVTHSLDLASKFPIRFELADRRLVRR